MTKKVRIDADAAVAKLLFSYSNGRGAEELVTIVICLDRIAKALEENNKLLKTINEESLSFMEPVVIRLDAIVEGMENIERTMSVVGSETSSVIERVGGQND